MTEQAEVLAWLQDQIAWSCRERNKLDRKHANTCARILSEEFFMKEGLLVGMAFINGGQVAPSLYAPKAARDALLEEGVAVPFEGGGYFPAERRHLYVLTKKGQRWFMSIFVSAGVF